MVFREPAILAALGEIGDVTERYLCDFTSMPSAQYATTFQNSTLQRLFCATVLPFARHVDAALFRRGEIPLVTRQYVFMGYHCVVR